MKKRLESELISIAHRVLKLKNKSDVDQLYRETQKLYETLSVLKFYHENFEQLKSEVSEEVLESKLENDLSEKNTTPQSSEVLLEAEKVAEIKAEIAEEKTQQVVTEEEAEVISEEVSEESKDIEIETPSTEAPIIVREIEVEDDDEEKVPVGEAKDDLDFEPIFELEDEKVEEKIEEKIEEKVDLKPKPQQISFEDLLGQNYSEPVFVKPNDITSPASKKEVVEEKEEIVVEKTEEKATPVSDKPFIGINVGLNDRIAFVKNLFADSSEDFNRVISQLNTFDSLQEAREFIEDMVKPDYNDWKGKEEYEERFMEIIERKFA